MNRLRGALLFSALAQQSNLLISFFSIAVIARLLAPAEIGVFAVASSLMMLGIEIRSFGVGQYLVREKELTEDKKRTAFGMMLLISWGLAALIIASAPLAASFYRQEDLLYIFWILSGTFVLAPFSTVQFALMSRDMRFDLVLRVKLTSGIVRASASIGFVLLGWSYFGLAAAVLLGAVAELVTISWLGRAHGLSRPSLVHWREVLGFGLVTSGAGVLQRFTQGVPDLVLGRMASMADVGLFSRGLGLVLFLNRLISLAVGPVILPHLSEIRRRDGNVGNEYLRCIVLHGAVSLPAYAVAGVLALPLIRLFFGDQWDAAAPIASVLSLWAMLQTVHGFLPNALLATGRERVLLYKEAVMFVVRLALIVLAAPQGLIAIAWALCLSALFEMSLGAALAARCLGLAPGHVARVFLPNVLIACSCWITAVLVIDLLPAEFSSPLIQVVATGFVTLLVWLGSLRVVEHDLWRIGVEACVDGHSAFKNRNTSKTGNASR